MSGSAAQAGALLCSALPYPYQLFICFYQSATADLIHAAHAWCACREGDEAAAASSALLAEVPGAKIFYITGGAEAWRVRVRVPVVLCLPGSLPGLACLPGHAQLQSAMQQCMNTPGFCGQAAFSWPALSSHHSHIPSPAAATCLPAGGWRSLEGAFHPCPARAEPGGPQQQHQQHCRRREGACR